MWFDQLTVTTDRMRADMDELRITTNMKHPDLGTRQFTTLNFQLRKESDGSQYRSSPDLIARAWYTGHDYVRVTVNYQDFIGEDESIPTVDGTVPLNQA